MARARTPPQGGLRDHDHSRPGEGGDTLDVGEITVDDVNIDDDDTLDFGTDEDYFLRYNTAPGTNRYELVTADADGGGAQGRVFDIEDGADDVRFAGGIGLGGNDAPTEGIAIGGGNIDGDDGFEIVFGTGDDMDVTYASGNDALEWSDRGTSTRMQLDRTTGNLNIEGSLTEGAAL